MSVAESAPAEPFGHLLTRDAGQSQPLRIPVSHSSWGRRLHRKRRLAAAFRLFGAFGFGKGMAGHITVHDRRTLTTSGPTPTACPSASSAQ
jgi:hypothetical protein